MFVQLPMHYSIHYHNILSSLAEHTHYGPVMPWGTICFTWHGWQFHMLSEWSSIAFLLVCFTNGFQIHRAVCVTASQPYTIIATQPT